jgi:hypothetical protein
MAGPHDEKSVAFTMSSRRSRVGRNMTKLERVDEAVGPVPPFQTVEEEARYWDEHSVVSDVGLTTEAGFRSPRKSDTLTIRFGPADIQRIRKEALQRGVGPTTLVRMWMRERLQKRGGYPGE